MTFHFSYEMAIFILFILIYQVMLVMEVLSSKRKLQRCLDEFGEHYSKLVVGLTVANALLEPFLFEWPFMITPGNLEEEYLFTFILCLKNHLCVFVELPCSKLSTMLCLRNCCFFVDHNQTNALILLMIIGHHACFGTLLVIWIGLFFYVNKSH